MRGEDEVGRVIDADFNGSPPHARGRPRKGAARAPRRRITPACAGKTSLILLAAQATMDHPRMRGEDVVAFLTVVGYVGSPPHARGRHPRRVVGELLRRITPACAGKTSCSVMSWVLNSDHPACAGKTHVLEVSGRYYRDHPRMRGEDGFIDLMIRYDVGSPPHARGRPPARARRLLRAGITPACAGKTPRFSGVTCGLVGSPPHARGRRSQTAERRCDDGITPACAGKTLSLSTCARRKRDHPRMRGEDVDNRRAIAPIVGSPPHARGRPYDVAGLPQRQRITPACAGKTPFSSLFNSCSSDHPRMRGEDTDPLLTRVS